MNLTRLAVLVGALAGCGCLLSVPTKADRSSFHQLQAAYRSLLTPSMEVAARRAVALVEHELSPSVGARATGHAGDALYGAQVAALADACISQSRADCELSAAQQVDAFHGEVIRLVGIRSWPKDAINEVLPEHLSPNLTARISFVGLSVFCSEDTPHIASLLRDEGLPCDAD